MSETDYYESIFKVQNIQEDIEDNDKIKIKNDWIISYYSQKRLLFEFITCVMVLWDVVMCPFYFAFGKP